MYTAEKRQKSFHWLIRFLIGWLKAACRFHIDQIGVFYYFRSLFCVAYKLFNCLLKLVLCFSCCWSSPLWSFCSNQPFFSIFHLLCFNIVSIHLIMSHEPWYAFKYSDSKEVNPIIIPFNALTIKKKSCSRSIKEPDRKEK